jgi:aspartate aminotransferase
MAGEFDQRRRVIVAGLNRIPGWRCPMPPGAFYAFPGRSGSVRPPLQRPALRGSDGRDDLPAGCGARRPSCRGGFRLRPAPPDLVRVRLEQIREGLARIEAACAGLDR